MPWMSTPREMLTWTSSAPSPRPWPSPPLPTPAQASPGSRRSARLSAALSRQASRIASRWPPLPPRKTASGGGRSARAAGASPRTTRTADSVTPVPIRFCRAIGSVRGPLDGDHRKARHQAGRFDRERPRTGPNVPKHIALTKPKLAQTDRPDLRLGNHAPAVREAGLGSPEAPVDGWPTQIGHNQDVEGGELLAGDLAQSARDRPLGRSAQVLEYPGVGVAGTRVE